MRKNITNVLHYQNAAGKLEYCNFLHRCYMDCIYKNLYSLSLFHLHINSNLRKKIYIYIVHVYKNY